jgi:hypothetical protein
LNRSGKPLRHPKAISSSFSERTSAAKGALIVRRLRHD